MSYRILTFAFAVAAALVIVAAAPAGAQTEPPRTAWGAPDLGGVWDFRSITRMERPEEFGDQEFLTAEEVANLEQRALDRLNNFLDLPAQRTEPGANVDRRPDGGNGSYNHTWLDQGLEAVDTGRTSLIVDPPNGRYPPLTVAGQRRVDAWREHRRNQPADSWLDFSTYDRCLLGFNAGPPMTPSAYNNNMQLFQTPDHVAIVTEMVNTARIVPLDGRRTLPADMLQWSGESRGALGRRYAGHRDHELRCAPALALHHRQHAPDRAVDPHRRRHAAVPATVNDPETWERPWTFEVPMKALDGEKWEYACHEGHHSMPLMLGGARALEARDAAGGQQ